MLFVCPHFIFSFCKVNCKVVSFLVKTYNFYFGLVRIITILEQRCSKHRIYFGPNCTKFGYSLYGKEFKV